MSAYTEMRFFAGPNLKIFSSRRSRMFSRSRRRLPRGSSSTRRPPDEAGEVITLGAELRYGGGGPAGKRPGKTRSPPPTGRPPAAPGGLYPPRRAVVLAPPPASHDN